MGSTDVEGKLTVNATPMDYWGASAASGERLYFLFKKNIEVGGPTSIDLDASQMPTGQLKLEKLMIFDSMWVSPHSQSYRGGSSFEVGEGDVMVLSADSYWISGWLRAQDDEGNIWDYRLSMGEVAVPTEGMAGISAGGSFSISTTPDSPIYGRAATSGAAPPEAVEGLSSKVTLHNDFADSFGNRLSEIRKWSPAAQPTPGQEQLPFFSSRDVEGKISLSPIAVQPGSPWVWERIYPHLVVTDPNGNKIVDESSWDVWRDFSFIIPHDAAEGEYSVDLSLDTGPHQGVINAVSSFQVQGEATGILVQVLNQDGEPARFARVVAYSDTSRCPDAWGWTGGSGFAWLDVPDGTYALVASSWNDHFLIVQEDVTAPSSVTMNTAGTVEVSFSVKDLAGNPMRADIQLKPYPCFWGWVGSTDVEGKLTVNATPMDYWGASAASRGKLYFLFERDIEVAGPTSVDLDASQMPTGQLKLEDLVNFDSMGVSPHSQSYRGGSSFEVGEGDVMVLSADSYSLWGGFRKQDDEGNEWEYHVSMGEVAVSTGAMASISAGGSFSISTTPGSPIYGRARASGAAPEAVEGLSSKVTLHNDFTDSFGNRLSWIWRRSPAAQLAPGQEQTPFFSPPNLEGEMSLSPIAVHQWVWESIYPHLVVTDPDGNKIVDENSRELWWRDFSFIIPHDAAEGEYIVELSLDTGPHQGVINAQNTFHVDRRLPGDANDDGIVDTADLTLVAVSFNRRADDQGFDPAADLNDDGIVDVFDLVLVGRNFGRR
ncbi:MAG: hypothetical protein DDT25_01111 [Chloroflexi bacterium]|nr:hypothetical protein [Chloroflexota bacterium]